MILKGSSVWRDPSVGFTAPLRPPHNAAPSCAVRSGLSSPGCCESMRGFAATSKLRPKFRGGKIKTSGGFKERFKLTGTGELHFTVMNDTFQCNRLAIPLRHTPQAACTHLHALLQSAVHVSCCTVHWLSHKRFVLFWHAQGDSRDCMQGKLGI